MHFSAICCPGPKFMPAANKCRCTGYLEVMAATDGKETLVTLTEEMPEVDDSTSVVIGNLVRSDVACRSDVLSGVRNTNGLAGLPGHLRPEDVHLWQTACLVDCEPSTAQLITILKVRLDLLAGRQVCMHRHLLQFWYVRGTSPRSSCIPICFFGNEHNMRMLRQHPTQRCKAFASGVCTREPGTAALACRWLTFSETAAWTTGWPCWKSASTPPTGTVERLPGQCCAASLSCQVTSSDAP